MKTSQKIFIGLGAVAALGVAATTYAVDGPGPGMGMGPMGGMHAPQFMPGTGGPAGTFDPAVALEAHLTHLKSALKITTGQEAVWNAFADKAKLQAQEMKAAHATAAQDAGLPAPDRMAKHLTQMQQHLDSMKSLVSTEMKNLYDILTPEQKAIADKTLGRLHKGMRRPAL